MTILIENLTFDTIIGILETERVTPQKVIMDCVINYHYAQNVFINYVQVSDHIQNSLQKNNFLLIEEALQSLGTSLKKEFSSISTLSLTLRKPDILSNCTVGVQESFIF
ncbi:MAG: 7,8-dihydroneopterin aldolase/epimerase/oxygenase [Campylobacterota bacterium]|nr:7,8-dihydroneopterin aldolase/epimerase/oxygenase [Campylobacterota bacterium]